MGSGFELNDTLQITTEQGFPAALDVDSHFKRPFRAEDFKEKIFSFHKKPGLRIYHAPPVRNFLVHNVDGRWIYWGLVHITKLTLDYISQETSGEFKILYIYTPEEMRSAHKMLDQRASTKFP